MTSLNGPEFIPDGPIQQSIIFLHGLGSNGDDLLSLAPFFADALPMTVFLAPNAPLITPFAANGYQWFEYWERSQQQIKDGLDQAAPVLQAYIAEMAKRFSLPAGKIILCGFSQGTMTALHAGLALSPALGGVIGFSGALLDPYGLSDIPEKPAVLLVHGLRDDVVPASASTQAEAVLKQNNYDVTYLPRPLLGHSIDDAGIRAAIEFCLTVFKGSTS